MEQNSSQPVKIDQKIVGYSVSMGENKEVTGTTPVLVASTASPIHSYDRPDVVTGFTYKIKPPTTSSAMYITINHIEDEHGVLRPIEIFVNTKHMEHFQWVAALTRMISAVLRKPGPFLFIVEELQQVFDPQGGYWYEGKMIPSVVAHIGAVFKHHCQRIGILEAPPLSNAQKEVMAEKKAEAEKKGVKGQLCAKCGESSVVKLDGCMTCLDCGDSKCG